MGRQVLMKSTTINESYQNGLIFPDLSEEPRTDWDFREPFETPENCFILRELFETSWNCLRLPRTV